MMAPLLLFACGEQDPGAGSEPGAAQQGDPAEPAVLSGPPVDSALFGPVAQLASGVDWPLEMVIDETHVYISVFGDRQHVARLPKDGGVPEPVSAENEFVAYSLNIDSAHIYWTDQSRIWRHAKGDPVSSELVVTRSDGISDFAVAENGWFIADGSIVGFLPASSDTLTEFEKTTGATVRSPIVHGQYGFAVLESHGVSASGSVIKAYSLPDGEARELARDSAEDLQALATDGTYLYAMAGQRLLRIAIAGNQVEVLAELDFGLDPGMMTVDDENVYLVRRPNQTDCGSGSLVAVRKSGGTPTVLVEDLYCPLEVAADATGVYWITTPNVFVGPNAQPGTVQRLPRLAQ